MADTTDSNASASAHAAGEYETERRKKREALREAGLNPYGRRVENVTPNADVRAAHTPETGPEGGPSFTVAGRVVLKRDMGKLSFLTIRDDTGDLQIGLQKNRLDEQGWLVRNHLDLGDLLTATGPLGTTKTGEPTVWAEQVQMASKSLVVPPDKHKGLEDVELRYRQRYVDLWANPEVMETMKLRMRIVERMRQYLVEHGYLEVETPMLQSIQGGAAARPFQTHHNAYDIPLFLRIAPELYLKRLLVGGFRKVFEINRNFRNEGVSPRHNPEFTMLEAYEAYGNYETMADMVEDLICTIAQDVFGTLQITHPGAHGGTEAGAEERDDEEETQMSREGGAKAPCTINLRRPWRRVKMVDLVEERTGWKFDKRPLQEADSQLFDLLVGDEEETRREHFYSRLQVAENAGRVTHAHGLYKAILDHGGIGHFIAGKLASRSPAEQLVEVYEKLIEPTLIDPCFVTHVPSVIIPLARPSEEDPYFAEVYELAINGQEISPGYTELNDPDVQEQLFRQQVGDEAEKQDVDEDFLNALKVGMPPAGGMGLGVDRLVMMLTGAESIRDVLLFPLMKPRKEARSEE